MKIGITGSNNTGKTTLAYKLVADLREHGLRADIAHESVRCCPLGTKERASVESQIWIAGNQIMMEEELSASEDIVICDKTVIDTFCYGQWAYRMHSDDKTKDKLEVLEGIARTWAKTYDALYYLPLNGCIPHKAWHKNLDHREVVDYLIGEYVRNEEIGHTAMPCDFQDRVDIIIRDIVSSPIE